MANHSAATAKARLLEMIVRVAFVTDARRERHMTDWPALRFYSQVGQAGRTRAGLANYLGVPLESADGIVARLLASRDLMEVSNEDGRLQLTQTGEAVLVDDPIYALSIAIDSLPTPAQEDLGRYLEALLATLKSAQVGVHR